jgi:hypothetical protein
MAVVDGSALKPALNKPASNVQEIAECGLAELQKALR